MNIKSENDLQECIDKDYAWRKKELTALKVNIAEAKEYAKNTALRAGITLLYAHWEGLVKNVSTYYLCFVSSQKIPYNQLKKNFLAIAIKSDLSKFEESNKTTLHTSIVSKIFEENEKESRIPFKNIIKTNSNLKSEIFKEIMTVIGLSYSKYELSFKLLDEKLLMMRNKIAHGERLEEIYLGEEEFELIYSKMKELMNMFTDQVMTAAFSKDYMNKIISE